MSQMRRAQAEYRRLIAIKVVAEEIAEQLEQTGRVLAADPVNARLRLALGLPPDPMVGEK